MKKYFVQLVCLIIGVTGYLVLGKTQNVLINKISILWCTCLLFYMIYYINFFLKVKNEKVKVNKVGVLGGRMFGIFFNMFLLEYILELYQHRNICLIFMIIAIGILLFEHKFIIRFFVENRWEKSFFWIYVAFNILLSSTDGIIGSINKDFLLVYVGHVSITAKIILLVAFIVIYVLSEIPDSIIMRIATKNETVTEE